MIRAATRKMTFDDFLEWYPDGRSRYELIQGVVVQMQPTGSHEEVTAFIAGELFLEVRRLQLPYFFPRTYLVKPPAAESGYQPDVLVLDKPALSEEPLWQKAATICRGSSVKLAVERVSTNWRDDYLTKLADYERMGIPEYWIVDYRGLGGRRYIGSPKVPTVSVYQLVDEEYRLRQFRGSDRILSAVFPELQLTAEQIFAAE